MACVLQMSQSHNNNVNSISFWGSLKRFSCELRVVKIQCQRPACNPEDLYRLRLVHSEIQMTPLSPHKYVIIVSSSGASVHAVSMEPITSQET